MGHHHHHHHNSSENLKVAFFLNLGFTLLEIVGGFYVNSVAILSDAVHDLGDSLSLGLGWYLDKKSKQSPDNNYSFGYQRFTVLAAFINSLVLILGSVFVVKEAIERLIQPESSDAKGMLVFAILGIAVNGYAAYKVSKGTSLNERVVSLHLLEDVLGWVAIFIASLVLLFVNLPYLDPILSLAISTYMLWNVVKSLKGILAILMQAVPSKKISKTILDNITTIDGIESVHNAHFWSLDGEHHVFTLHIVVSKDTNTAKAKAIKQLVKAELANHHFKFTTLEIEFGKDDCSE